MSGDMMPNDSKGFVIPIPGYPQDRKLSFQLTPQGVRYFIYSPGRETWPRYNAKKTDALRDMSTQFGSLSRLIVSTQFDRERMDRVKDRLMEHAKKFYPPFCIPDAPADVFSWVAFPMLGAAMKQGVFMAPRAVNLQIASGLRALSVKDMTNQIFSESPRQLQAAISRSMISDFDTSTVNVDNLTLASLARGYLPPNSLAEVLSMNLQGRGYVQQIDKPTANAVRMLLRRFRPQRIMRLLHSFPEDGRGDMLLGDAGVQYAMARRSHPEVIMDLGRQFKSIKELHDVITREYRKLKNPDVEISYSDEMVSLLDEIVLPGGSKLAWPKSTHELITWGDAMNNCIYSYGKDAADGRNLLFGIVDASGDMTHNIMVRNKNVVQCYGKSNERCTDDGLIKALFDKLIDMDVIGPDNDYTLWCGPRRGW